MMLDDIRNYLVAQGSVTALWPCYIGYMPDSTDQMIALFESGGYPAAEINRENIRPTFQVRVRAAQLDYVVARAKWQELYNYLQDAQTLVGSPTLLSGYAFIQAMASGPLHFNDEKQRPNLTANFRVMKTA